jgi:serine/threonine protein phosphatase PrpC
MWRTMEDTVVATEIRSAGQTRVGMVRTNNQDYFGLYEPSDENELSKLGRLYVVCDGMGGAAGGEIASKLGTETIIARYKAEAPTAPSPDIALKKAIEAANRAIWDLAKEKPELTGMGSTTVALVIKDGIAYVGHDGDSRGYVVRQGQIRQITKDHSMVQQMLDAGLIDESEVADHPRKNVIMRCLGVKPEIDVETGSLKVYKGDLFYLCSDGLWGLVKKDDCARIINAGLDDLPATANALLEMADKNGGSDNSTVVMARVMSGAPDPGPKAVEEIPPPGGGILAIAAAASSAAGGPAITAPAAKKRPRGAGAPAAAPAAAASTSAGDTSGASVYVEASQAGRLWDEVPPADEGTPPLEQPPPLSLAKILAIAAIAFGAVFGALYLFMRKP